MGTAMCFDDLPRGGHMFTTLASMFLKRKFVPDFDSIFSYSYS